VKLTFNGTAAAEGFPAVFCECKYCKKARELGGKNIRTRSSCLINEEYLIDKVIEELRDR
jgi:phosphoribosyl 1,2-cyclic phosphate phosphodiesterase